MKKSPLKKQSKLPTSKAKRLLLEDVKKLVRESGKCAAWDQGGKHCGGVMQASHIKSEGAYKNLFVDPNNILPMCWVHHFFWWHKEPTEAGEWLKKKFPFRYEYLEWAKKEHVDWTLDLIASLRAATKKDLGSYIKVYAKLTNPR
jgi:hypothetical protein